MLGSAAIGHPQSCPAPDRPQLYAVQPSPGSPLVYYCIEIQPTIRPTLFHPAAVSSHKKCWRVGAEPQQSGSSHSRAVFLHCPDTTTGSGQPQKTGWNYLIFYTARPRRLLTLSSSSPLSQVSLFTPAAASPSFSLFLVCPSARCVEVSTNFRESFHSSVLSKVHTVTFTLKNILKHCSVVRSG